MQLFSRFFGLLLFFGSLLLPAAETPNPNKEGLRIYWTDVEGGAATLLVTPAGESILIDTGMPGGRDAPRIHKTAQEAGLKKIDYLITTHLHLDHFGGAAELSELMPIGTVLDNGIPDHDPDGNANPAFFLAKIKPYREFKADKRQVVEPGSSLPLKQAPGLPRLSAQFVAAKQKFAGAAGKPGVNCDQAKTKAPDKSDNANSIVILFSYGDFQFFVAGDLTWNVEAQLVCPTNRVGEVDVYQVTHHGLDQSNNPLVVQSVKPRVAVMSNGTIKGCGPETFATLKSTPGLEAIYQIHRNLRVDATNNTSDEMIANRAKDCAANGIKLATSADGRQYTVSIPAHRHSKTFQTK